MVICRCVVMCRCMIAMCRCAVVTYKSTVVMCRCTVVVCKYARWFINDYFVVVF